MISKPTIIISSLGRTGTRFFATLLGQVIPDCASLHEPDVFQIVFRHGRQNGGIQESLRRMRENTRQAGASYLLVRKALGRWSLVEVSDARIRGTLGHDEAVAQVLRQRKDFVRTRSGSIYVESSMAYYGLMDVVSDVYAHHRIAYIVRDARDWIRSTLTWGEMYGKGKIRSLVAHTWPTAKEIKDDPYRFKWDSMSHFERLCWAWVKLNEYALGSILDNASARVFRFEDIFLSQDRYQHLADLVQFVTRIPDTEPIATRSLDGWLDRQVHRSVDRIPPWEEWSAEQLQPFRSICGPLMDKLGYEFE